MKIRVATMDDQKRLAEIARTHRAGQGFTHFMFSGEAQYAKGWLRVAVAEEGECTEESGLKTGDILGFTCVRHKVRQPKTMLYYIIIDPSICHKGVGRFLLGDLKATSPHRCIELSCLKDNHEALAFYAKHGFVQSGESLKGKGWHLELSW